MPGARTKPKPPPQSPPHRLLQRLALGVTAPSFWRWALSLHDFPPLLENLVTNVFPGEKVVYLLLR